MSDKTLMYLLLLLAGPPFVIGYIGAVVLAIIQYSDTSLDWAEAEGINEIAFNANQACVCT